MHLFDANSRIHKYDNTTDIMTAFYDVRYDYYGRRKEYQLGVLQHQLDIIHYKVKFLEAVITDDIVVAKQSKAELIAKLEEQQYPKFASGDAQKAHNYNYLLTMPIYTLTTDTLDALRKLREEKQTALSTLQTNTLENMWCTDLKTFRKEYISIQNKIQKENEEQTAKTAKMSEPKKKKQKKV